MAYTVACFLRSGLLDEPVHKAIRRYLWLYRLYQSEVNYAMAVSLLINLNYHPIVANEICVQFNRQCDKRKPLSQVVQPSA